MAQQDNTGVGRILDKNYGDITEEDIDKAFTCKCCKLNSISIIVSSNGLCFCCLKTVPEHIPKEQVLRFAITLRERKRYLD